MAFRIYDSRIKCPHCGSTMIIQNLNAIGPAWCNDCKYAYRYDEPPIMLAIVKIYDEGPVV